MLSHTGDMGGHRLSLRGALSPLKADPGLGHCLQLPQPRGRRNPWAAPRKLLPVPHK